MSKITGKENYHQSSHMKNACHFKPKAKYPIKKLMRKKEGKIINHQEHKRRLDTRKMLVISIPLKIPIKISNTCHLSPSRQNMLYNRKMVHCTIAMPNQNDQQNINTKHARMRAYASALLYDARALRSAPMLV